MPSSHLILCRPLLLLPPIPPTIRVFSNESTLRMRGPKYWSFSFSIIPSKEIPGLISFRMDWLDLLAVQGTLKSLFLLSKFLSIPAFLRDFMRDRCWFLLCYWPFLCYWTEHFLNFVNIVDDIDFQMLKQLCIPVIDLIYTVDPWITQIWTAQLHLYWFFFSINTHNGMLVESAVAAMDAEGWLLNYLQIFYCMLRFVPLTPALFTGKL